MRFVFFLMLFSSLVFGQYKTPFKKFDEANRAEYVLKKKTIQASKSSRLEKINLRIQLASRYKEQDDLISALEDKISNQGESAQLLYFLGGANGIKALQVNRMFSVSYVKAMLKNFKRALALNPNHLPALEAYIESLSMVPSLIGGDIDKAKVLAKRLMQLDQVKAYFSFAFIATAEAKKSQAKDYYKKAFDLLEKQSFCSQNLSDYFAQHSMNFSYKIAEDSMLNKLSPAIGLCAIDYFIDNQTPFYNIPLEWAYYQKAQLLDLLGDKDQALLMTQQALSINPNFELGQALQTKQQKGL